MSHCLLVWKQCLAAKIIMTNTNIVEFYFNNIQHVRYVICLIFKYLQQHCFPVYLINSIPLTKCKKTYMALPWGPVTWSRTPGRSGYPSWRHPTCRPRRRRHRAEGRTNGRNPRDFSMGKWGTSKNSWGFMGTPCFFKESHMRFRMPLILWRKFLYYVMRFKVVWYVSLRLDVFWTCLNMFWLFLCSKCASFVCNVLMC